MKIIWYGHSCFEITGNDGTVIFDPYQEGSVPGLNKLHLKGNLVLCSHDHDDHNARDCVDVLPKEFEVEKIETYHDHHQGSRRGKNTVHIVEIEDMKIASSQYFMFSCNFFLSMPSYNFSRLRNFCTGAESPSLKLPETKP